MNIKGYLSSDIATKGVTPLVMIALAGASVANAADLAVRAPVFKAPPVAMPSWAGFYVGLNIGGASESNYFRDPASGSATGTHRGSAFIGGGQIGYNWQQGNIVYGLEGDISGLSKPKGTYVTSTASTIYGSHVSWLSTGRARLGVTIGGGDTLLYGTGGVAVGRISAKSEGGTAGWPLNSYSHTRVGWTAGGGIEHRLAAHWTIGLEGLFVGFGSSNKSSNNDGKCCATIRDKVAIGRFKLNYKF